MRRGGGRYLPPGTVGTPKSTERGQEGLPYTLCWRCAGCGGDLRTALPAPTSPPPGARGQVLAEGAAGDADAAPGGRLQLSLCGNHHRGAAGPGRHPAAVGAGWWLWGDRRAPSVPRRCVPVATARPRPLPPGPGAVPRGGRARGEATGGEGEEADAAAQRDHAALNPRPCPQRDPHPPPRCNPAQDFIQAHEAGPGCIRAVCCARCDPTFPRTEPHSSFRFPLSSPRTGHGAPGSPQPPEGGSVPAPRVSQASRWPPQSPPALSRGPSPNQPSARTSGSQSAPSPEVEGRGRASPPPSVATRGESGRRGGRGGASRRGGGAEACACAVRGRGGAGGSAGAVGGPAAAARDVGLPAGDVAPLAPREGLRQSSGALRRFLPRSGAGAGPRVSPRHGRRRGGGSEQGTARSRGRRRWACARLGRRVSSPGAVPLSARPPRGSAKRF